MKLIEKHRAIKELGQRAIDYYIDTGLCVFCEADDCIDLPHEEHCNVGELSGVSGNEARKALKREQRKKFHEIIQGYHGWSM